MISDLSDSIDRLGGESYTVKRRAQGTYSSGVFTTGAETTFQITALVAPLRGRELQRLAEGMGTTELLEVFTATELRTQASGGAPDHLVVNGIDYEVQQMDPWAQLNGVWRVIVSKKGSS